MNRSTILFLLVILLLSCLIALGSGYYFGIQKQAQQIQFLQNEKAIAENRYAEGIESIRKERGLGLADYQSSCYEYKKLREAYDALYARTGENSGLPPFTFPDSAKGNEESCYR